MENLDLYRGFSFNMDCMELDLVTIDWNEIPIPRNKMFTLLFQIDGELAEDSPDVERKSVETNNLLKLKELGAKLKEPSWVQEKEKADEHQDSISLQSSAPSSKQSSAQSSKRSSFETEMEESEGFKKLWRRMTSRKNLGSDPGSWNRDGIQSNPVKKLTKRIRSATRSQSLKRDRTVKELLDYGVDDLQKTMDKEAKKQFRLTELVDFEENYLRDLSKIVQVLDEMKKSKEDPNHPVPMPLQMREGRDVMVLNNFHDMHRLHRDVIGPGIRENLHQPEKLKQLFEREASKIKMLYSKYFSMHLKIARIIKIFHSYFKKLTKITNLELNLSGQINLPSMHLTRYPLFFQALAKSTEEEEANIYWDIFTTTKKMSQGINDMMAVKRVTNLPPGVDQFNQGDLIHRGPLVTRKKTGSSNICFPLFHQKLQTVQKHRF